MGLPFRIFTASYGYVIVGLAIFVMAHGLLGKKMRWKPLVAFCLYSGAVQWANVFVQVLLGVTYEDAPLFLMAMALLNALVLGGLLRRSLQLPFLQTLTAAVLGTFIVSTVGSVIENAVSTYGPLLDRQYQLAFIRIYVPYTLSLAAACLVSLVLRKSEFYQYFSALFLNRGRAVLTLLVSVGLMWFLSLVELVAPETAPDVGYAMFFFALIVVGLFLIQFAAMYAAGQDKIRAQEEIIVQQQAHMALLEELQQEIRAFRHDFTNLFSGLTLQAQQGDLAGIQDFMRHTSSYFDEKLGSEIAQMDGLSHIELFPLRSLLTAKLAKMREKKVKAVLEVLYPVRREQGMDSDDLLRAVGILLDNAIEAAPVLDGVVRIILLQEESALYIAIANNYESAPDLSALARQGYTTKGSGHGTGLASYRKIVARCKGCTTRTYLKDDFFVQALYIPALSAKRRER